MAPAKISDGITLEIMDMNSGRTTDSLLLKFKTEKSFGPRWFDAIMSV
jgi:hypothetical protein